MAIEPELLKIRNSIPPRLACAQTPSLEDELGQVGVLGELTDAALHVPCGDLDHGATLAP